MKLLHGVGFVVSLAFVAAGLFELRQLGWGLPGVFAYFGGAVTGFAISLTLWGFQLRDRIAALERAASASKQPGS